ncbi:DUF6772 family protein [Jiangella anatolica]|uniref:Uncharacterized protein n=1 Tax=Jiangella anatolica TaxID=2670374 RepID=A0A2W2CPP2_9ACTN|nr:DUF6772 family protein [Jiangella anatolica]PZF82183.1 hypothetical protein C1I92_17945 [Jiangella anatolica]
MTIELARYNPLRRVLSYDDFDRGVNGWCELCGNHDGDLDTVRPSFGDLRPPQLSTVPFFDIGSHGAMTGTYALKLATRPRAGHTACLIKRLTLADEALVQFETYFAAKPEARQGNGVYADRGWDGNEDPSEYDLGAFTLSNDIGRFDGSRYHCALRYQNTTVDGELVQGWYYKTSLQPTTKMQLVGQVPNGDFHTLSDDDWQPVPGGQGPLCFNEVPTKVNWHYLRWQVDTKAGRNVELQVNDRVMDLRDIDVPVYPHPYTGLRGLFNLLLDVRTHRDVRNFLFLDSCVISADW